MKIHSQIGSLIEQWKPHRSVLKFTSQHCANVYVVSWIGVTENRHVGRRSHLRPKDTLAEVTFPSHNAAEYIEHAQLLAMDYPNMLTADAVRNNALSLNVNEIVEIKVLVEITNQNQREYHNMHIIRPTSLLTVT